MFHKKSAITKITTLGLIAATMFSTPVLAASSDPDTENGIQKTVTVNEDGTTVIEGMISNPSGINTEDGIMPAWLAPGKHTQYPAEGGTWEYGFWNAKVRSYYTVDCKHGSTVKLGENKVSRSIDTAANTKSIAELYTIQTPNGDDHYYYRIVD